MTGAFRPRHRPWRWGALWLAMIALVAVGSLMPAGNVPTPPIAGLDKLQHLAGHGLLSAYAAMLFATPRSRTVAAIALLAYGAGIEAAQDALTASREADMRDIVANAVGVLLGQTVAFTPAAHWLAAIDARIHR